MLRPSVRPSLKALEEVVELLGAEVPRQLGQQVVHVLDDGLVLPDLRRPEVVQVLQAQSLLLDDESEGERKQVRG